jgi:hypothetical protein
MKPAQNATINFAIGDLVELWYSSTQSISGWKIVAINTNGTYNLEIDWSDSFYYTPVQNVPNGCISRIGQHPTGNPPHR